MSKRSQKSADQQYVGAAKNEKGEFIVNVAIAADGTFTDLATGKALTLKQAYDLGSLLRHHESILRAAERATREAKAAERATKSAERLKAQKAKLEERLAALEAKQAA